jgi:hypothetical protein
MSFRTVKHLCGHEARYRLAGGRTLVEHHMHELESSPCTPCATAAALARRHIYLGADVRIVSLAATRIASASPADPLLRSAEVPLPNS